MRSLDEFRSLSTIAFKKIRIEITELTPEDDDKTFTLMGLDSLDIMNYLLELEILLDAPLEEMDMKEYNTIAKIYSFYEASQK